MATLEEFLRYGKFGGVVLGMTPSSVMIALGQPNGTSKKSNPLLLRYGNAELAFWKNSSNSSYELRQIVLKLASLGAIPEQVMFADFVSNEATESEFMEFVERINLEPVSIVEGPSEKRITFLSGVSVDITDGWVERISLSQGSRKETSDIRLSHDREPTVAQIKDMFDEAEAALTAGANRASFLLAWAALEASLRQAAHRHGGRGKIGVQPSILIRELVNIGVINPHEHAEIESLRQTRTALAHGLAPSGSPVPKLDFMKQLALVVISREPTR